MDHQLESRVAQLLGIDESDPVQRLATELSRTDRAFIDALVAERRRRGLTQAEVSTRMGVSQSAVSHFESGDRDPKLSTIRRYALALGVPVEHRVVVEERAQLIRDEAIRARDELVRVAGKHSGPQSDWHEHAPFTHSREHAPWLMVVASRCTAEVQESCVYDRENEAEWAT